MTLKDARELATLMRDFGLSHAKVGDIELHRPDAAVFAEAVKQEKAAEPEPDPLEVLERMSPDAVDRALALGRTQ